MPAQSRRSLFPSMGCPRLRRAATAMQAQPASPGGLLSHLSDRRAPFKSSAIDTDTKPAGAGGSGLKLADQRYAEAVAHIASAGQPVRRRGSVSATARLFTNSRSAGSASAAHNGLPMAQGQLRANSKPGYTKIWRLYFMKLNQTSTGPRRLAPNSSLVTYAGAAPARRPRGTQRSRGSPAFQHTIALPTVSICLWWPSSGYCSPTWPVD